MCCDSAKLEEQLQIQEDNYRMKLLRYMEFTKEALDNEEDIEDISDEDKDSPRSETSPSEELKDVTSINSEQIDSMRLQLTRELVETFQVKERQTTTALDRYDKHWSIIYVITIVVFDVETTTWFEKIACYLKNSGKFDTCSKIW